jgi:hypothetical protein
MDSERSTKPAPAAAPTQALGGTVEPGGRVASTQAVRVSARRSSPARAEVQAQAKAQPQPTLDTSPAQDSAAATTLPTSNQEVARSNSPKRAPQRLESQTEHLASVARLQAALQERYIIKRATVTLGDVTVGRTEYRFRGDTSRVAFTESSFRLATDTNSPSVARSMVDVAEARQWKALRVSGSEDFRRLVWLEASARGVKTLGYEPDPADLELLRRERDARASNLIEPAPGRNSAGEPTSAPKRMAGPTSTSATAEPAPNGSARGGSRKAVLAAIEAVLVAQRVPETRRLAVLAAAAEQLAQRLRDGRAPQVKVYDKAASTQRPVVVTTPPPQRSRDRATPSPSR